MQRVRQSLCRIRASRFITTQSTKIDGIVDTISELNLMETASLVAALKKRLNLSDVVMNTSAAPVAQAPKSVVVEAVVEQTSFKVTLAKFDAATKAKIIKEIKQMIPGANLVEVVLLLI